MLVFFDSDLRRNKNGPIWPVLYRFLWVNKFSGSWFGLRILIKSLNTIWRLIMVLGATDSGWTNSETWYVVRLPKLSRVNEIIEWPKKNAIQSLFKVTFIVNKCQSFILWISEKTIVRKPRTIIWDSRFKNENTEMPDSRFEIWDSKFKQTNRIIHLNTCIQATPICST